VISGYGWGGMPTGPDGLGGYFGDSKYSSLSYNDDKKCFQASWPNMWSSAPFLTICDPHMNAYLKERIERILFDLTDQMDYIKASGGSHLPILVREWGSNGGEVTQVTIDAAKLDGVVLDPAKGLGYKERLWMYRHAVSIWQSWADHMVKLADKDSVLVKKGDIIRPETQQSTELFAHPDFNSNWPMNDVRYNGGQIGMVDDLSSSGEMGMGIEYREMAVADYLCANGRLAMVNMERPMLKDDFSVLKNYYQKGFQFAVMFNSYDGDEKFISSMDNIDNEQCMPAVHREPSILSLNVQYEKCAGNKNNVCELDNLKVFHSVRLANSDCLKDGYVTYRLENSGELFQSPLNICINGRVSPGNNNISIYAGESISAWQKSRH
jgi:hypothetical protein